MARLFIFVLIFLTNLFAESKENNSSTKAEALKATVNEESPLYEKLLSLDYIQSSISKKVLIFSNRLDHSLTNNIEDDANASTKEASSLYGIVNLYDNFFKDETYLSTTNKSYIRLRLGAELNAEEGFEYFNNIRVSLRLPKTEKALYFFVGDETDEETRTINKVDEDKPTSIGIKYVLDNLDILDASLFGGFRGISNPFIKLRFQYPIAFEHLLFRPVQYIEYSLEDEFKEETQFYFDHRLENRVDLMRLSLKRYTKTYLKGMNYSAQLSYISTLKHSIGFQVYALAQGQTKIQTTQPANIKYNVTPTKGIYNYSTGIVWRQQLFKKYLFYELQPLVEFDQQYNYSANYIFRAHIELYFGNI
ncbi:hypothetical protein M947_03805 [Sulfurimonas hongkongensis]|uniref:Uncharacterized protein n=1 Tax=Sulfurimonas hongkongensis TaxID=1172190 RepID=T0KT93_9BACT|nr:hypothetical protein [Sulfurimonas hongkongensis]EQB40159.1 hypothetical protein M947_03805 [Sulfurimonas hongkongensis]